MKLTRFLLAFGTLALTVVSAATFHFTVNDPQWIAGKELKPGDYSLKVEGDKATIKAGKNVIEVPAKIENANSKYDSTTLFTNQVNGKSVIGEIRIGGSKTKVVFGNSVGSATAQ